MEFIDRAIGKVGGDLRYVLSMSTREILVFGDGWTSEKFRRLRSRFKMHYTHIVWFGGVDGTVVDSRIMLTCGKSSSPIIEASRKEVDWAIRAFRALGNNVDIRHYNL